MKSRATCTWNRGTLKRATCTRNRGTFIEHEEYTMKTREDSIKISEKTITEFAKYLYIRENAEATIKKYTADIKNFFLYLDEGKTVNKVILLQYKESLIHKYSINSVNSILAAINQFLEFIDAANLKVKRIKIQKQPFIQMQKELTKEECRKLIRAAKENGKEQLALCMETIACTGIRISELKYFTIERIKSGKIEIYNKGKYRRIFLPKQLRKNLLAYCKQKQICTGWVFVTKNGKLKDRSNIWREMKSLKEKAGVSDSKIFPHNLRHLFARTYYEDTKDIAGLADLLGHSSVNVTRIYTATTEFVFQKQLNRIIEQKILGFTT